MLSFTHTCVIDPMPIADGQFSSPSSVVGDDGEKVQQNIEQARAVACHMGENRNLSTRQHKRLWNTLDRMLAELLA